MTEKLETIRGTAPVGGKALARLVGEEHVAGEATEPVVFPGTEEEVAELVKWCGKNLVPITLVDRSRPLPHSLPPPGKGIALDLKRLKRVFAVNDINHTVEAQAGISMPELERELQGRGFSLGRFAAELEGMSLGGWLAAGGAETSFFREGEAADLVISLAGVLPNGDRFVSRQTPRSATGPDLDHLILGSDSTLAIITSAVLAVRPLPKWSEFRAFRLPDFQTGLQTLRLLMRQGLEPVLARLNDEPETELLEKSMGLAAEGGSVLLLGFEGPDHPLTRKKAGQAFALIAGKASELSREQNQAWLSLSSSADRRIPAPSPPDIVWGTIQAGALWSCLPSLHHALAKTLLPGVRVAAHVSRVFSTGAVVTFTVIGREKPNEEICEELRELAEAISRLGAGSSCFFHRGEKKWGGKGSAHEIFVRLKKELDPGWIFNPGKFFLAGEGEGQGT